MQATQAAPCSSGEINTQGGKSGSQFTGEITIDATTIINEKLPLIAV